LQSRRIYASRSTLAESTARARQEHGMDVVDRHRIDGTYRHLHRAARRKRAKAERKAGVHWGLDARKIVTPSQRSIPIIVPMVVVVVVMVMVVIPATGRNHINARTVTVTVTVTPPMMVMVMVVMVVVMMVPLR
jgi:magnesium-transporting ATPase (P-type)